MFAYIYFKNEKDKICKVIEASSRRLNPGKVLESWRFHK